MTYGQYVKTTITILDNELNLNLHLISTSSEAGTKDRKAFAEWEQSTLQQETSFQHLEGKKKKEQNQVFSRDAKASVGSPPLCSLYSRKHVSHVPAEPAIFNSCVHTGWNVRDATGRNAVWGQKCVRKKINK